MGRKRLFADFKASDTELYKRWTEMKNRCYNPKATNYRWYGQKGIKVCDRWLDYLNFYADMNDGYKSGLTLERERNNEDYGPSNCRWVTKKEQQLNVGHPSGEKHFRSKLTDQQVCELRIDSKTMNIKELGIKYKMSRSGLYLIISNRRRAN